MTKDVEIITIQFDESKIVFQKWIELFVALGEQIIDSSASTTNLGWTWK